jgi:hypothetical protein
MLVAAGIQCCCQAGTAVNVASPRADLGAVGVVQLRLLHIGKVTEQVLPTTFPKLHMPDSTQLKDGSAAWQSCAHHPMTSKQYAIADLNFIATFSALP